MMEVHDLKEKTVTIIWTPHAEVDRANIPQDLAEFHQRAKVHIQAMHHHLNTARIARHVQGYDDAMKARKARTGVIIVE